MDNDDWFQHELCVRWLRPQAAGVEGGRGIPWSTRLDKLEAAMRGRDTRDSPDEPWISRLIYDPSEWQIEEDEAISKMKTEELDRVVAAGTIREIDRESVRFIVRRIVQPPEQPDDCLPTT